MKTIKFELQEEEAKTILEALIFSSCGDSCLEDTYKSDLAIHIAEKLNIQLGSPQLNVNLYRYEDENGVKHYDDENSEKFSYIIPQLEVKK